MQQTLDACLAERDALLALHSDCEILRADTADLSRPYKTSTQLQLQQNQVIPPPCCFLLFFGSSALTVQQYHLTVSLEAANEEVRTLQKKSNQAERELRSVSSQLAMQQVLRRASGTPLSVMHNPFCRACILQRRRLCMWS